MTLELLCNKDYKLMRVVGHPIGFWLMYHLADYAKSIRNIIIIVIKTNRTQIVMGKHHDLN